METQIFSTLSFFISIMMLSDFTELFPISSKHHSLNFFEKVMLIFKKLQNKHQPLNLNIFISITLFNVEIQCSTQWFESKKGYGCFETIFTNKITIFGIKFCLLKNKHHPLYPPKLLSIIMLKNKHHVHKRNC